jgi:hypothetical protein
MSNTPGIAEAALRDDVAARHHFGCSARQLRHIRYAAETGRLSRRAAELGISLPPSLNQGDA